MADETDSQQRMTIRFAAEDVAWIAQAADDEGVDNATMVRMIINRLRRGRAPLISMMEAPAVMVQQPATHVLGWHPNHAVPQTIEAASMPAAEAEALADDVLTSRMAELAEQDSADVVDFPQETAAVPLRRAGGMTLYNPRPK